MELLDFLSKYWNIIVTIGSIAGIVIHMYYSQKAFKKEMEELKQRMTEHDEADKKMKDELIGLIDRNKLATEKESKEIQNQLSDIKTSLAVVNNNLNLIIGDKLK